MSAFQWPATNDKQVRSDEGRWHSPIEADKFKNDFRKSIHEIRSPKRIFYRVDTIVVCGSHYDSGMVQPVI